MRPSSRFAATAAALGGIIAAGCAGGTTPPVSTAPQPGWTVLNTAPVYSTKSWTFLVYLNGANDLDADGLLNIEQMEQVGSTQHLNIVAQWKRDAGWSGATRRYYITRNANDTSANSMSLELSTNAAADMGQAQTLQDFVQWGIHSFPAHRYCLVLWDHGAGWRAERVHTGKAAQPAAMPISRGISYDDLTGSHIDTTQLPAAIDGGNGFQWDLLAMDASLMQMAEVDYEMRNQTHYIVGSEESPPEQGYPYNQFLADLAANPSWDGSSFGVDIANKTLTAYTVNSNITQSVIDASQLGALAPAVNALGSALTAVRSADGTQISAARGTAESVQSPDYAGYYRDLMDFTQLLVDSGTGLTPITDAEVQSAASGVKSALKAAIVYNVHGNQHPNTNGLTIFLTTPSNFAAIESQQAAGQGPGGGSLLYTDLAFTQAAPNWLSFLGNGPP